MNKLFKPEIQGTNVYIPPNSLDPNERRLFLNENLLGCAPSCLSVLQAITPEDLLKYALGDSTLLKEAIAEKYGINIDKILVHEGEAELLKQIFQAFLNKGDVVLTSKHSWGYYRVLSELQGAKVANYDLEEREGEFSFDSQEMIRIADTVKPKIIVLISPNMPTGNSLKREDLEAILATAKDSIVILDEAYFGFKGDDNGEDDYRNLDSFLEQYPNLIVTRTFSKLYALASLRIGYAFCGEDVHDYLQKTAPLFGINYLSQLIAKEALKSMEYYEGIRQRIVQIRQDFGRVLGEDANFKVYRSDANFVLVKVGEENAEDIQKFLSENGFKIRDCSKYYLPSFVRISLGTHEDMNRVAQLMRRYHLSVAGRDVTT